MVTLIKIRLHLIRDSSRHIHYFPIPIMQYVLAGSLHKNNTSYLLFGLYHAAVNWISIVLMQITSQNELYYGICENSE